MDGSCAAASASASASASQPCDALVSAATAVAKRFINDDACGDWVLPWGAVGLEFQAANALSASCFVIAGAPLIWKADTPIARLYGLMMVCVGIGSFSYHATTAATGFIIDIVPMAVTAALLTYRGMHALQAQAGVVGPKAESTRMLVAAFCASFAVYVPWSMMAVGISHSIAWGVWALLFGSMGAAFAVICLMVLASEGLLRGQPAVDLAVSIACVLLGLGCSVHSFIPGMCEGWRTLVPLHAFWHVFASISSNRCGYLLDTMSKLAVTLEGAAAAGGKPKQKEASLWLRLLKRDILPSQFSM